jgi:nucleoside 2-deoxyribosyltransferase
MKRLETVYLAGFEAFLPEPDVHDAHRLALARRHGLTALIPGFETEGEAPEVAARAIYAHRAALMRRADAAIVNLTPWRGPACDPGAAFEAGFAAALGKPVFAYMNIDREEEADYRGRVDLWLGASQDEAGIWRDAYGCAVEDLGLPATAMLWAEARRLFVIAVEDPMIDLTGLELCLEAARAYGE